MPAVRPARALVPALILCAAAGLLSPGKAWAHGERSQVPFLRTQTIAFWDVGFSRTRLEVGERLEVTGKFRLMENWPQALPEPTTAFLTVISPGPVFLMKDRIIDGRFVPQSISPQKGRVHEFRMDLLARRAGRWHIHPSLAVKKAGPLIGPGRWIEVEEGSRPFRNVVALENGEKANLENHNLLLDPRLAHHLGGAGCPLRRLLGAPPPPAADLPDGPHPGRPGGEAVELHERATGRALHRPGRSGHARPDRCRRRLRPGEVARNHPPAGTERQAMRTSSRVSTT